MTKVRSREECLTAVQGDVAWRKKEIAAIKGRLSTATDDEQKHLRRAAVVMIYAHWEGFVKTASELYIEYINEVIARQSVTLSDHFTNLLRWKLFRRQGEHLFLKNPIPYLQSCAEWPCDPKELLPTNLVDTESNLSSDVLRRLTNIINVDYGVFQTKEKLIDESLLKTRNQIAHGERVAVEHIEYEQIEREVRGLIDQFQLLIEGCIEKSAYRATSASPARQEN